MFESFTRISGAHPLHLRFSTKLVFRVTMAEVAVLVEAAGFTDPVYLKLSWQAGRVPAITPADLKRWWQILSNCVGSLNPLFFTTVPLTNSFIRRLSVMQASFMFGVIITSLSNDKIAMSAVYFWLSEFHSGWMKIFRMKRMADFLSILVFRLWCPTSATMSLGSKRSSDFLWTQWAAVVVQIRKPIEWEMNDVPVRTWSLVIKLPVQKKSCGSYVKIKATENGLNTRCFKKT